MAISKMMVVLAASRKFGGRCYAGKEITTGGIGPWIRPVTASDGALDLTCMQLPQGGMPNCLDIVELAVKESCGFDHQRENWLLCPSETVTHVCELPQRLLPRFADVPATLWATGYSSSRGQNDRVPLDWARSCQHSLQLVQLQRLTIAAQLDYEGKRRTRAFFSYRGVDYGLAVTDPDVEQEMAWRDQDLVYDKADYRVFACISLGLPHYGYCYKLLAAVHLVPKGI